MCLGANLFWNREDANKNVFREDTARPQQFLGHFSAVRGLQGF